MYLAYTLPPYNHFRNVEVTAAGFISFSLFFFHSTAIKVTIQTVHDFLKDPDSQVLYLPITVVFFVNSFKYSM